MSVGLAAGPAGLTVATLTGSAVGLLALIDLLFAGGTLLPTTRHTCGHAGLPAGVRRPTPT